MLGWVFLVMLSLARADLYLHNPRGSNNRLDENTRERKNANRMFDSQNNNRGGYNVGEDELMYYYSSSVLPIEWTNQHSCGNENSNCEIVIQYMCGDNLRDGTVTRTIPEAQGACVGRDCNTDQRYGLHESAQHYANCRVRRRNEGLFTSDQKPDQINRNRAIHTRQNPAGTRRGYECPEERDYYPYWHPSPWKDIVVMTNDVSRCDYYRRESENVKGRWYCHVNDSVLMQLFARRSITLPNNKEECEEFYYPSKIARNAVQGEWRQSPSHGLSAPDCRVSSYSRDNHLGNGPGGYPNTYNWAVPDLDGQTCVLRVRYNISTTDYDGWNTFASDGKVLNLASKFNFKTEEEAEQRGYVLKGNPQVKLFEGVDVSLEVNLNTNQLGRTFQDRSHTFVIMKRPASLGRSPLYNINVRGKRGNIVQVFPAVEYDFVPNTLVAKQGDLVHFQWTGSDSNPANNAGEGAAGTDRSNVLLQSLATHLRRLSGQRGSWGRSTPENITSEFFLGLNAADRNELAALGTTNDANLNKASAYFDLGARRVRGRGTYYYMCTRNNNFSNRSQKGRIIIQ